MFSIQQVRGKNGTLVKTGYCKAEKTLVSLALTCSFFHSVFFFSPPDHFTSAQVVPSFSFQARSFSPPMDKPGAQRSTCRDAQVHSGGTSDRGERPTNTCCLPALLWEMDLFGPIKARLCADTSIHVVMRSWGKTDTLVLFLQPFHSALTHTHPHTKTPTHTRQLGLGPKSFKG